MAPMTAIEALLRQRPDKQMQRRSVTLTPSEEAELEKTGYLVVCDERNNGPVDVKDLRLNADVFIIPRWPPYVELKYTMNRDDRV
jgi:hypothetical protein